MREKKKYQYEGEIKKISQLIHRTINGLGETHEGSLRALKMLKEHNNDALEQTRINPAVVDLGDEQELKTKDLIRARFAFDT